MDRPNVVLIVADDLDADSLSAMPFVSDRLRRDGVTFSRCYATTPICGPARASLLRGQYAHNHGMLRNNGENGGFHTFHLLGREESTLATWLQKAGYRTALVGKYLNGYPRLPRRFSDRTLPETYVPPGWDEWFAQLDRGALGGPAFRLNENGRVVGYEDRPENYTTDVLARHAIGVVERAAGGNAPFFLNVCSLAPHHPAIPAPRHLGAFVATPLPQPPSFDEADVGDKPAHIRNAPRLLDEQVRAIEAHHRDRLRCLLALDELVAGLVDALAARGVLDRTTVLVTSDHGWHRGEHRLPLGKETPYEESIRIPLGAFGWGVAGGRAIDDVALNLDLAPTIADLAGADVPPFADGRSLASLLRGERPPPRRQAFLVEHESANKDRTYPGLGTMPEIPDYRAVRTGDDRHNLLYVEYATGEREFYDLGDDPHQLNNFAREVPPAALTPLAHRLDALRHCAGETCRSAEDAPLDLVAVH
jgi:arylsulfatase A-like enzyme